MKTNTKIAVIGGDARQIFCASNLSGLGCETAIFGFDKYMGDVGFSTRCSDLESAIKDSNAVILPLPCCTDGVNINAPLSSKPIDIESIYSTLSAGTIALCGKNCRKIKEMSEKYGIKTLDYYDREEFKIANAVPTAESALALAINEMPITVCKSTCLVMGYGRIGKVLCNMLKALGAKVYASARKCEDFAWIEANGLIPIHTKNIKSVLPECSLIFNTIPKTVLKDDLLKAVKKDTLIIDLASKPGGVDFEPAKKAGLNVIWALSLPGKTAPVSAGEILADTIINILDEAEGNK